MKNKKLLAILACVLLVACVGCKSEKQDKKKTSLDGIEKDAFTENLEINDYEEYNFRILIRPGQTTDQYVAEGSADPIADAVYKRNMLVEEMYNIKISATESSHSNSETDALNSILAGDDAYDIIFPHSRAAFAYASQDALLNVNEIKSIKTQNPWWSKDAMDSFNINGNLYVIDGDISLSRYKGAMCMFFNKRLFDELGLEYPYQMVIDGTWTFDEFAKLTKKGASDLNGDGVWDPEYDQYGFVTTEWQAPISILYTGGQKIYDKNDDGIPELTLKSSKTVDIFDSFFDLMDSESNVIWLSTMGANPGIFGNCRALMQDGVLGGAQGLRSMDDDFGILPYPKFTESDEYATVVNGFNHLTVIPKTVSDPERTGNIIEALCAIGSRDVIPVFYDVSLKTKFSRDKESEAMIDIIRDSIIYDIGYVSGGTFQSVGKELANSHQDFSSYYSANEGAAIFKLNEFNRTYGGIE